MTSPNALFNSRLNPWQSYRQVATQTASPGLLVLMLYDGAIRFLERAVAGFSAEDPLEFNQTINNNILRAQEIIAELNNSLNLQDGGEFAHTLRRLYNYMDWRLQQSNLHKQESGIREVIGRLGVLRDAWAEMLGGVGRPAAVVASAGELVMQA
jgi:flagellar protein FliS